MAALIMCANTALLFSGTMREYKTKVIAIKFLIRVAVMEAGFPYLSIGLFPHFFKI
jgi:hypothetical protein